MTEGTITDVSVATVCGSLPAPVVFGDWIMRTREYAIVRVTCTSGVQGWAFTLTRDGAVAEHIKKTVADLYIGTNVDDAESTFHTASGRSPASHASGIGLRALSIVDLAMWDARAKSVGQPIAEFLGGRAAAMPATAIIGYPPALMDAERVAAQVTELRAAGWRRFKAPVGVDMTASIARLVAARQAAPDAWLGHDGAWTFRDVDTALAFLREVEQVELGWFEDMFPPGDAKLVASLRARTSTPIAMGDEQGGSYYPQALLLANAVDVVRIDLTCMGGISGGRRIVDECLAAGVAFAPHMFAHVHSRVFSGWGLSHLPVEWGVPWTGVDPYADSLEQPVVNAEGMMLPLAQDPGFGELVNREWISTQQVVDPDGILGL